MEEGNTPKRFVPSGVDAQTWIGFEARIQERRFKALLETINTAIVARDGMAARVALEELRELRPASAELPDLAARVALLPVGVDTAAASSYLWSRGLGAVATFVVGVGLVIGLETVRPGVSTSSAATATPVPAAQVLAPAADATSAGASSVPATAVVSDTPTAVPLAPAPLATEPRREEPVGTAGVRPSSNDDRATVTPNRATFREAVDVEPVVQASGEIPDDYVAPRPRSESRTGFAEAGTSAGSPLAANVVRRPDPITQPAPAAVPASNIVTPAATTAPARNDSGRVAQVLNQYARAYGDLNPAAAHAVWPTVDERALSRAFASLESQDVSFDNCDIDVKGATASALCHGHASYVPKVGNRDTRTEPRQWNFQLTLQGDDWKIAKADVR